MQEKPKGKEESEAERKRKKRSKNRTLLDASGEFELQRKETAKRSHRALEAAFGLDKPSEKPDKDEVVSVKSKTPTVPRMPVLREEEIKPETAPGSEYTSPSPPESPDLRAAKLLNNKCPQLSEAQCICIVMLTKALYPKVTDPHELMVFINDEFTFLDGNKFYVNDENLLLENNNDLRVLPDGMMAKTLKLCVNRNLKKIGSNTVIHGDLVILDCPNLNDLPDDLCIHGDVLALNKRLKERLEELKANGQIKGEIK